MLRAFSSIGANRLLLTHMDELNHTAVALNLLKQARLPASFLGDGVDLFDGLREASVEGLSGYRPHRDAGDGQAAGYSGKRVPAETGLGSQGGRRDSAHYVANRNSELFHRSDCKSVRRINAENITPFNSIEQAINKGFKPCRACCNISMIRQPVTRGWGDQRARAI